jgi:hypothetical protein
MTGPRDHEAHQLLEEGLALVDGIEGGGLLPAHVQHARGDDGEPLGLEAVQDGADAFLATALGLMMERVRSVAMGAPESEVQMIGGALVGPVAEVEWFGASRGSIPRDGGTRMGRLVDAKVYRPDPGRAMAAREISDFRP